MPPLRLREPDTQARFVAEASRVLGLLAQAEGRGTRYHALLAGYREVADALGCRAAWEEVLLRATLRPAPPGGRDREEADVDAVG